MQATWASPCCLAAGRTRRAYSVQYYVCAWRLRIPLRRIEKVVKSRGQGQ